MRFLEIENWNRKQQFRFFKDFDNPFFNVCTEMEINAFYKAVKSEDLSFSIACLFTALKAANETEPLRYRLHDDKVAIHDQVHAGNTILNDDETFNFCYFEYDPNFRTFYEQSQQILKEQDESQQALDPRSDQQNLIHCSTLPWYRFTSFSHARNYGTSQSIPKFVFGKYFTDEGMKLPFSIEVHHALMDGIHVGHFLDHFQSLLTNPKQTLGLADKRFY